MSVPELIVFDLDFTLWECGGTYCDCLAPPFANRSGKVVDRYDRVVRLYPDVAEILHECDAVGISMALASRTEQPVWARQLIDLLDISYRFEFTEIFPDSKLQHFAALRDASGVDYDRMLFFDDEQRNIVEVGTLGVTCVFVPAGINRKLFRDGMQQFLQSQA